MKTTVGTLKQLVRILNLETRSPLVAFIRENGKSVAQVGSYYLDSYQGYCIEKISTDGGGVSQPFGSRRLTAREMEIHLRGVLAGIELAKAQVPA